MLARKQVLQTSIKISMKTGPFRRHPGVRSSVHMEAATPLRQAHVRVIGDRVAIDGLVVDDECAVRLVRGREEHGDDPVRIVLDAIEIGARVLDREQAGANAEFVKAEFEKASRDVQHEFTEQARTIAQFFETQFASVFGEEDGSRRSSSAGSATGARPPCKTGCARPSQTCSSSRARTC
jgi:hypothetical protein